MYCPKMDHCIYICSYFNADISKCRTFTCNRVFLHCSVITAFTYLSTSSPDWTSVQKMSHSGSLIGKR